jgi:hypothetical protein
MFDLFGGKKVIPVYLVSIVFFQHPYLHILNVFTRGRNLPTWTGMTVKSALISRTKI